MIRSILTFLKLWLRYDFGLLSECTPLTQLVSQLHPLKSRPSDFVRSKPLVEVKGNRSCSVNMEDFRRQRRCETNKLVFGGGGGVGFGGEQRGSSGQ